MVVLGAARSGTKLLRGILSATRELAEVPFDVNYLWRLGNEDLPHDAIPAAAATPPVQRRLRARLARAAGLARDAEPAYVEKTVSNVLRIPFVLAVLPDAHYVHLVRDGRDVVESAIRSWQEVPAAGYLLRKARTFPWLSALPYAVRYGRSMAGRLVGRSGHVRTWGPRYPGIDGDVAARPLAEVCALQWLRCVEAYEAGRDLIPPDRLVEVRYEDLMADPSGVGARLGEAVGLASDELARRAAAAIDPGNVGKHRRLAPADRAAVEAVTGAALARWGYQ